MKKTALTLRQQIRDIYATFPGYVVLSEVGKFYEIYNDHDNFEKFVSIMDLKVAKTGFAGFPLSSKNDYLKKLFDQNLSVVLVHQSPSKTGNLIDRHVEAVLTPGTHLHESVLESVESKYLMTIKEMDDVFYYVFGDITTNECFYHSGSLSDLTKLSPKQILCDIELIPQIQHYTDAMITPIESVGTSKESCLIDLRNYAAQNNPKALDQFFETPVSWDHQLMYMNEATIRSLEIVKNQMDGSRKATLYSLFEPCTATGKRLLVNWLRQPSTDIQLIQKRLDKVEALIKEPFLLQDIRKELRGLKDIERSMQLLRSGRGAPVDFTRLISSLKVLENLSILTPKTLCDLPSLKHIIDNHDSLFTSDGAYMNAIQEPGVIADGVDEELDQLRENDVAAKEEAFLNAFSNQLSLKPEKLVLDANDFSIKIKSTSSKVEQILKTMSKVRVLRGKTLTCQHSDWTVIAKEKTCHMSRLLTYEKSIFDWACREVLGYSTLIFEACQKASELDVLCSFAHRASAWNYSRPNIVEEPVLDIKRGRHPVIEQFSVKRGDHFVSNDLNMCKRLWVLTGCNMGGKSTFLRQNALICILAQCGSFVPCEASTIGIVDQLLTRIGSADYLSENQSTFFVEMAETADILSKATERSLVILDEVGRGTSTKEGISCAFATLKHLHDINQCRSLFATHYLELKPFLESSFQDIAFYQTHVHVDDIILPTHQVIPGFATKSFAIETARIAGMPSKAIDIATEFYHQSTTHLP